MTPTLSALVDDTSAALGLTPRLAEVLRLRVEGLGTSAIARRMGIDRRTVQAYSKRVCQLARVQPLTELVARLHQAALDLLDVPASQPEPDPATHVTALPATGADNRATGTAGTDARPDRATAPVPRRKEAAHA